MYKMNLVEKFDHIILTSFGATDEISHFLGPKEFILLQALNKFTYWITISRAQMHITFKQHFMFTFSDMDLRHTIFVISED